MIVAYPHTLVLVETDIAPSNCQVCYEIWAFEDTQILGQLGVLATYGWNEGQTRLLDGPQPGSITIEEQVYAETDPFCCPSLSPAEGFVSWDGTKLDLDNVTLSPAVIGPPAQT